MPDRLHALPPQPCVVRREPPVPAYQCQAMLLQYQCPERFPLAGHSSTQQSMYETACHIMLLMTSLKMCWTLPEQGAWAIIIICLRLWPLHSSLLFAVNHWLSHGDIYHVQCCLCTFWYWILFTYASYNKKKKREYHAGEKKENIMPENIVKHNTILNNFIIRKGPC